MCDSPKKRKQRKEEGRKDRSSGDKNPSWVYGNGITKKGEKKVRHTLRVRNISDTDTPRSYSVTNVTLFIKYTYREGNNSRVNRSSLTSHECGSDSCIIEELCIKAFVENKEPCVKSPSVSISLFFWILSTNFWYFRTKRKCKLSFYSSGPTTFKGQGVSVSPWVRGRHPSKVNFYPVSGMTQGRSSFLYLRTSSVAGFRVRPFTVCNEEEYKKPVFSQYTGVDWRSLRSFTPNRYTGSSSLPI